VTTGANSPKQPPYQESSQSLPPESRLPGQESHDLSRSNSEASDETLVSQVAQGDVAAFADLYDRYARPIYTLAVYTLGDTEAEEVTQEVFLRLWRKADQFDASRGLFRPWFMTIARNQVLDRLRDRDQKQILMAVEQINYLVEQATDASNDDDIEEKVWLREQGKIILDALKRLPAEQRQAIVLAYFGGLSQSSIAKQMGWPLGTVKKRTRLGLQKLRRLLKEKGLNLESQARANRKKTE